MGKRFNIEIIRNLVKIASVSLLIFCVSAFLGIMLSRMILPNSQVFAANQIFAPPTYNWYVCEDLGIGTVPGVPGLRQILRLCHNQGWEIRTYCLQPGVPVPPIGSTCSHTPEGTYWCGDGFQLLQEFAQDVTPTSSPAPTETNTNVPTQTTLPSITNTPSQTPTETLTPSATEILTDTPPPTITPRLTRTPTLTLSPTNTPRPSNSQTPIASITSQPSTSITPSGGSTETPVGTSTNTVNLTETPLPSTLTPGPTFSSETPTPTPTIAFPEYTPVSTPRPRPGGSGNIVVIGLLGVSLGILSFAIGFLSLLLIRKDNIVLRLSFGLEKSQFLPFQKIILIQKWFLLLVLLGLITLTGYLVFTQIPRSLIGFQQPVPDPEIVSLALDGIHTPTPFQPRHPTPTFSPIPVKIFEVPSLPTFNFRNLDFSPQSGWRKISIDPPSQQINQGKAITLSFIPDRTCVFGDQRACVSVHSTKMGNLIFLTIHSGYGGEGQAFRHAVEGTAINAAAFSLAQVQANLTALRGAQVSISADGDERGGFILKGVIRIPATLIEEYFALPIEDALELAGSLNAEIWATIDHDLPMLVFETCGWKVPSEAGAERVIDTTGSVYVALIQPMT